MGCESDYDKCLKVEQPNAEKAQQETLMALPATLDQLEEMAEYLEWYKSTLQEREKNIDVFGKFREENPIETRFSDLKKDNNADCSELQDNVERLRADREKRYSDELVVANSDLRECLTPGYKDLEAKHDKRLERASELMPHPDIWLEERTRWNRAQKIAYSVSDEWAKTKDWCRGSFCSSLDYADHLSLEISYFESEIRFRDDALSETKSKIKGILENLPDTKTIAASVCNSRGIYE